MRMNTPRDHYFEKRAWRGYYVHGFLTDANIHRARWYYAVLDPDGQKLEVYSRKLDAVAHIETLIREQEAATAPEES